MFAVTEIRASQTITPPPAVLQPDFESDRFRLSNRDVSGSGSADAGRCLRFLRLIHSNPYSRPSAAREGAVIAWRQSAPGRAFGKNGYGAADLDIAN
jgi:hypothetical protein